MRKGWIKYKLSDLGFLGRGKSKHRPRNDESLFGGDYPFIQTGEIKAANIYISNYNQTYNEKGLAQSKLWNENTLCMTIAANIAETAILKIKACFPDSVVGFVANDKLCNVYFIKYYIDFIKNRMQSISGGACQDNLSLDKIAYFDIEAPEKEIQDKIANVLSNYDDLIENNKKRIKILEEMAQKIYKEWFVDFKFPNHEAATFKDSELGKIPSDWEIVLVENLLKRLKSKNKYTQDNVSSQGKIVVIDQSTSDYLGFHDNLPDFIATPEQPLIIFGDHTCKMQMLVEDFSIGPNVIPITSDNVPIAFLYYLIDSLIETKEYKRHWNDLIAKKVILPSKALTLEFSQKITPLMAMVNHLKHKNQTLKQTRDLLLPRLISGEIDVENLNIL